MTIIIINVFLSGIGFCLYSASERQCGTCQWYVVTLIRLMYLGNLPEIYRLQPRRSPLQLNHIHLLLRK